MEEKEDLLKRIAELEAELNKIRETLPICSNCKKIRDEQDEWHQVESFLRKKFGMNFTHGICPECEKKLYPDFLSDED